MKGEHARKNKTKTKKINKKKGKIVIGMRGINLSMGNDNVRGK